MKQIIATAALALVLAACGASGAERAASPSSADLSQEERSQQFARCMRDNGVDVPDPDPGGGFGGLGELDRTDPDFDRAREACRSLLPGGGDLSKLDPAVLDRLRHFTRCMRDNGIDLPDPDPNGGNRAGLGGIDRESPTFKSALEACQDQLPALSR
ncbi:hypothetical protein [Saccharothrix sp. HUAS TT1]|uniref:hypothetical protein n=1 Tax=unclassified Saccharothrix TaxID=2593673 RepID=UPI00345C2223